jgi:hypothetical protein
MDDRWDIGVSLHLKRVSRQERGRLTKVSHGPQPSEESYILSFLNLGISIFCFRLQRSFRTGLLSHFESLVDTFNDLAEGMNSRLDFDYNFG